MSITHRRSSSHASPSSHHLWHWKVPGIMGKHWTIGIRAVACPTCLTYTRFENRSLRWPILWDDFKCQTTRDSEKRQMTLYSEKRQTMRELVEGSFSYDTSLSVIWMYSGQPRSSITLIWNKAFSDVQVSTSDSRQGKENDVMIACLVSGQTDLGELRFS